jgi:hypothetical protein
MIDPTYRGNFPAINELCTLAAKGPKPLVLWAGAGTSAWAGLRLWSELADAFQSNYIREESNYDKAAAIDSLAKKDFPRFFGLCKRANRHRFNNLLTDLLKLQQTPQPVFGRFISDLQKFKPLRIITTNVDEALEQGLQCQVLLPHNIEKVKTILQNRESFIAKLHGSITSLDSTVFTDEDYAGILGRANYVSALTALFDLAHVVFIGYGLRDDYILRAIQKVERSNPVFGAGPHFAIVSGNELNLPLSVRKIVYVAEPHSDHRASLQVLEELISQPVTLIDDDKTAKPRAVTSAHLLSDVYPAGRWLSSQTLKVDSQRFAQPDSNTSFYTVIGHGLTEQELPLRHSTAMHDLLVGLLCFDKVYAPLSALARTIQLVGQQYFVELIRSDILGFVHLKGQEGIIYLKQDALTGAIATMHQLNREEEPEYNLRCLMARQLNAIPGREKEANDLFKMIEERITEPVEGDTVVPQRVCSPLLRPSVRRLLGISDGVDISKLPQWVWFPILRLAQVVRVGLACRELGIASVKFEFGNNKLAEPAFAAASGQEMADALASYIIAGDFSTDLGAFVQKNPSLFWALLKFRETTAGMQLRGEILQKLSVSGGGDVAASINAGLHQLIPSKVMEDARRNLARFYVPEQSFITTSIWQDAEYGEKALTLWKQRSRGQLEDICKRLNLSAYDFCPCGSGDKLKFCCRAALF